MPVHRFFCSGPVVTVIALFVLTPGPVLAYVGPGAGLELTPYFLAVVAWAGAALFAVLFWPMAACFRCLKGMLSRGSASANEELKPQAHVKAAARVPESTIGEST